jgi:energy-converting hydrogenase B subunit D
MEAVTFLNGAFDAVLGVGLLLIAWRSLACSDLFKASVLFVAFGLFMAIAWVRLNAPDVGLAEATIGAGVTGTLLMSALSRLKETALLAPDGEEADSSSAIPHRGDGSQPSSGSV